MLIYVRRFFRPDGCRGGDKYRLEHEAGLRLLAEALRDWPGLSGLGPEELEGLMAKGEGGKPWFPAFPQVHFNLSHSQDVAVCAVGEAPLGVDVEKIRPVRPSLARRMLTEGERRRLEAVRADERDREMLSLWTLKESLAKALGTGLALDLRRAEFTLAPWRPSGGRETAPVRDGAQIGFSFLSGQGDVLSRRMAGPPSFFQTVWEGEYVIAFCSLQPLREEPVFIVNVTKNAGQKTAQ